MRWKYGAVGPPVTQVCMIYDNDAADDAAAADDDDLCKLAHCLSTCRHLSK